MRNLKKIGIYCPKDDPDNVPRLRAVLSELSAAGCLFAKVSTADDLSSDTDMLLSVGGDGTLLSAAMLVSDRGVPVLGINFGRLGFLSETRPEGIAKALLSGEYVVEKRTMLGAALSERTGVSAIDEWPYALNEITVHRAGAAMLGVNVDIDGMRLPTYWADGLLVATASGSTAYSLSVGGPIVMPESKVLIVAPIASHNLNVRPLVVPETSRIKIGFNTREEKVLFTADNRTAEMSPAATVSVSMAQFSLNRVRLNESNFINALTSKLYWGEDIRNTRK